MRCQAHSHIVDAPQTSASRWEGILVTRSQRPLHWLGFLGFEFPPFFAFMPFFLFFLYLRQPHRR